MMSFNIVVLVIDDTKNSYDNILWLLAIRYDPVKLLYLITSPLHS